MLTGVFVHVCVCLDIIRTERRSAFLRSPTGVASDSGDDVDVDDK